jgi:hypothetical protein
MVRARDNLQPLLVDLVIRESRVKKVLVDGGIIIKVTFLWTLQALGVAIEDLSLILHSSASCRPKGSTHSDTYTCSSPLELQRTTEPSS